MKRDVLNFYPTISSTGDFVKLNPVENIVVEILNILISPTGEKSTRMWNINFGSNFLDYIFSLSGNGIEQAIASEIQSALKKNLDDVYVEVKNVTTNYSQSGIIENVSVDISFEYDDKQYIVTYNLPNNEMLLEGPTYHINQVKV